MKKWHKLVIISLAIFVSVVFLYVFLIIKLSNSVVFASINKDVKTFNSLVHNLDILTLNHFKLKSLSQSLNSKILILFQNNYELRPSGGFMGSFATASFKEGVLDNFEVQDIYVPDGQITGHIEPKPQIQQAFKTGEWRLPNSNWEIDFERSATDILWFFDKAGVRDLDTVIAINMGLVEKVISIYEPIHLKDFPEVITKENFYTTTQRYSESDFFPGSIKKKSFITALYLSLKEKALAGSLVKKLDLIKLVKNEIESGQILVYSKNNGVAKFLNEENFTGKLSSYENDYIYISETNLGANKANCCITRNIVQKVDLSEGILTEELNIDYTNNSSPPDENRHYSWGGDYINYLRIVIPERTEVKEISVNGVLYSFNNNLDLNTLPELKEDVSYHSETEGKYKTLGFWVIVPIKKSASVEVKYLMPNLTKEYDLVINRQPGIYNQPYEIVFNGVKKNFILNGFVTKIRMP